MNCANEGLFFLANLEIFKCICTQSCRNTLLITFLNFVLKPSKERGGGGGGAIFNLGIFERPLFKSWLEVCCGSILGFHVMSSKFYNPESFINFINL